MRNEDILTSDNYEFPKNERPVAAPLYQTSLFSFENVNSLKESIKDEYNARLYSRGNNPTVEIVEKRMALLEHGEKAKLFSSGVSAIAASILSNVKSGDHIICSNEAYTWARYLSSDYVSRFNISCSFVDTSNLEEVKSSINENTKILYLENPSSLMLSVCDLPQLVKIAKDRNIVTICDNTWATPLNCNPLDLGIDIVVHSASKYLGGHSDVIGGFAVSSNSFIEKMFRTEFLPIGTVPDPFQAWLIQRGMRTLKVRVDYHYKSTLSVCDYLYKSNKCEKINYPLHPNSEFYSLARKQFSGGTGLLSLKLKCKDAIKIEKFVNKLKIFRIGVSWGGYESLVFPVLAGGGDPSLIRLHIGLENTDTVIEDLKQALLIL